MLFRSENERLRLRVAQFFDRLETQFRQIAREARLNETARVPVLPNALAGLMVNILMGKIDQYVRSGFEVTPTTYWDEQWPVLVRGIFEPAQLSVSAQR